MIDLEAEKQKAENGDGIAAFVLGESYRRGYGVKSNAATGFQWYEYGSKLRNNALCLYGLGLCYSVGNNVTRDWERAGDYFIKAFFSIEKLANENEPHAQSCLGSYYHHNYGNIPRNYERAEYWYKKSAEQGYYVAQFALGVLYSFGEIEPDMPAALTWFRKAAEQNYSTAQNYLGEYYRKGKGVAKDIDRAVFWYKKSAEQGGTGAMVDLGNIYLDGEGVLKDIPLAREWFLKAVNQGSNWCLIDVATTYWQEGNYKEASVWYKKAMDKGNTDAKEWYNKCMNILSPPTYNYSSYNSSYSNPTIYTENGSRPLSYIESSVARMEKDFKDFGGGGFGSGGSDW